MSEVKAELGIVDAPHEQAQEPRSTFHQAYGVNSEDLIVSLKNKHSGSGEKAY